MKKYSAFLIEAQLSHSDAVKVLGLKPGYTPDDLSSTYKLMAKLHHPDKGGDVEQMKQINAAYNVLKGTGGLGDDWESREVSRRENDKKNHEAMTDILTNFTKKYQTGIFKAYFEDIFGEPFKLETKSSIHGIQLYVGSKYSNKDSTTVIELDFSISNSHQFGTVKLSPDEHTGIQMTISRTIFHNRRKIKLTKQNYSFEDDYRLLAQPEKLFPKDKLIDKSKNAENQKFKKSDAILMMKHELGANWDGSQWMRIPLNDKYTLLIFRTTMMGLGSWQAYGIYEKTKKVDTSISLWIIETQKAMYWFVEAVKGRLQKDIDLAHIQKVLIDMKAEYQEMVAHGL